MDVVFPVSALEWSAILTMPVRLLEDQRRKKRNILGKCILVQAPLAILRTAVAPLLRQDMS